MVALIERAVIGGVLIKAAFMAAVVTFLDIGFVKSLILVLASAIATGLFAILVAKMTIHAQQRQDVALHERLELLERNQNDIAGKLGARNRRGDPPAPDGL